MVSTDTIIFLETSPIEKYEKTIDHFIFTNSDFSIAEEWALHNKKLTMSIIDNKTFERSPFYQSFDEESFTRSNSVYREIIGLYFKFAQDKELNLLGPGMVGENIITDGTWSGDLFELVIADTIQEVYNYYKSIHSRNIDVSTEIKDGKLYILDDLKRSISIYDLNSETISQNPIKIKIPSQIVSGDFQATNQKDELVIRSDDNYFYFDINTHEFYEVTFDDKDYNYPKTSFVANNTLHTLARKSRIKQKMSIIRSEMIEKRLCDSMK